MKEALRFRDIFLLLLAVLVLIGFSHSGIAQLYPIQVNTSLTAPFTPYLTDYTNPGTQKLMVQVRVNDPTLSDYTGRFRITIEGVGITIRTKPTFVPQPVRLQGGGIPQVFYGEDLYEYFNPNNLDFAGISRTEFNKTGKLPEGVYRFTVEVLDYNRGTVVSNKGVTLAWIILNDPPLLNLPRKETKVRIIDPTNIPFTWTPRHTGSPNSAFTTEYIFRLVEIWPMNRNPYDAFLSQPPLYEITTPQTQIVYGPAEPALIPGRKYAWQVQAKDTEGRDLFKNQGRSEVFVFQFGDALGAPENVRNETVNSSALGLKWEPAAQGEMPTQYRVRYRPKGEYNSWYEAVTDQRWVTLSSLKAATDYEVQVRAEASPQVSEYSRVVVMKTAEAGSSEFSCGNETVVPPSENIGPLLILRPGDVISCRNFKVVVTEAQGSTGSFTGKGMMQVPMFSGASVWVTFASSMINRNYELTTGEVSTVYNHGSTMAQIVDEMHRIGEEKPQPKVQSDSVTITPAITHTIPGVIDSIYFDPDKGEVVVIDQQGNESMYKIPIDAATGEKQSVAINDASGNMYVLQTDKATT